PPRRHAPQRRHHDAVAAELLAGPGQGVAGSATLGKLGPPMRPIIGSLIPEPLMPKLRLRMLSSRPSTPLTERPRMPPSGTSTPRPLGAREKMCMPVKSLPIAVAGRSMPSSGTARPIQAVKVLEFGPGHIVYSLAYG